MPNTALIIVDLQNDFCPGGALAVKQGDQLAGLINQLMECFDLVVATQDWHPRDHQSFASQHPGHAVLDRVEVSGRPQTLWPDHCVQGTKGAELVADLKTGKIAKIFQKGIDAQVDSYSGFYDNDQHRASGLDDYLQARGVKQVYICGLALDYCVNFTARDAVKLGFDTFLIVDACRAVNASPGDGDWALKSLQEIGVIVIKSTKILVG